MSATGLAPPARWLAPIALGAAFLIVWILQHRYAGLSHDSQLYTLLASARRDPDLLGNDIMVRFGSQDSFTLFSPIYAAVIRLLGTEPAAALLTFGSHLVFFTGAALLARRLMTAPLAWLGVAMVCAIPGVYGARNVFAVVETFATPRIIAEGLVLLALAAFLDRRFWIAGALALAATALHPLMAAGGGAVALLMSPAPPRTKAWTLIGAWIAAAAGIAVLASRGPQIQFDNAWLYLLQTGTDYLFPALWPTAAWVRLAVVLSTLTAGALLLERSPARSLCIAAALAAIIGTAISYIGGDLLRIVAIVQMQLWRWNWIATFAATLMLPLIVTKAYSRGGLSRSVALLIGAAWLLMTLASIALPIAVLLIPLAALARGRDVGAPSGSERSMLFVAGIVAILSVLFHAALVVLGANAVADNSNAPAIAKTAFGLARTGALPAAAFIGVSLLVHRARALTAAGCIVILAALAPTAIRDWRTRTYGPEAFSAFETWRARIPPGTEVLWFDSPLSSWLLLQRPSYLSNQQEASALFSRAAAVAMKARVDTISPHLDPTTFVGWSERRPAPIPEGARPALDLAGLCASSDVKYVVTRSETAGLMIGATPAAAPPPFAGLRLYACPGA